MQKKRLSSEELKAELAGLKLEELKKRAKDAKVPPDLITKAEDPEKSPDATKRECSAQVVPTAE